MLFDERKSEILHYLANRGVVSVQELSGHLYASPSTVRRDLNALEEEGLLKRVHGGAITTSGSNFDAPAALRRTQNIREKSKIADLAERFLTDSKTYFFDSSSTALILAMRLSKYRDVQIATNGLGIADSLKSSPNLSIFLCGGYLRTPYDEFTGSLAVACAEKMHADVFFFSCGGFSLEDGATEQNDDNVTVKRAFFDHSDKHILLCDSGKFDKHYFFNSFKITEPDYIVTDRKPDHGAYVKTLGKKLIFCDEV